MTEKYWDKRNELSALGAACKLLEAEIDAMGNVLAEIGSDVAEIENRDLTIPEKMLADEIRRLRELEDTTTLVDLRTSAEPATDNEKRWYWTGRNGGYKEGFDVASGEGENAVKGWNEGLTQFLSEATGANGLDFHLSWIKYTVDRLKK